MYKWHVWFPVSLVTRKMQPEWQWLGLRLYYGDFRNQLAMLPADKGVEWPGHLFKLLFGMETNTAIVAGHLAVKLRTLCISSLAPKLLLNKDKNTDPLKLYVYINIYVTHMILIYKIVYNIYIPNWKLPRCLWTVNQQQRLVVCSSIEHHSSISKDKLLIHASVWTDLKVHANPKTSIRTIYHDSIYMVFWKRPSHRFRS